MDPTVAGVLAFVGQDSNHFIGTLIFTGALFAGVASVVKAFRPVYVTGSTVAAPPAGPRRVDYDPDDDLYELDRDQLGQLAKDQARRLVAVYRLNTRATAAPGAFDVGKDSAPAGPVEESGLLEELMATIDALAEEDD